MIEVKVENFQSIVSTTLTIDGFTALVGRSNIGKSAIVRAVRNALTGASGTDFVRHGASCERTLKDTKKCKCFTTVRIATAQLVLTWEKGDAVNRYTLQRDGGEPVVYDKVERGTPDFLHPEFAPVRVGDTPTLIQVSEQFRPIFLLGETGSTAADVLSDVARLDDINEAIKLATKDRKEAATTRTIREKDAAEVSRELLTFQGLDPAIQRVRSVEASYEAVQTKQSQVEDIQRFVRELEGSARSIRDLQAAMQPALPDEAPHTATLKRLEAVVRFDEGLRARQGEVDRLVGVEAIVLPAVAPLQATMDRFIHADQCLKKAQALKATFDKAKDLATLKDPDLDAVTTAHERLRNIASWERRLAVLTNAVETLEGQHAEAEREEANVLAELRSLGLCPTCAQPIGADQHLHLEAP